MLRVYVVCSAKTPLQSGRAKVGRWSVIFDQSDHQFQDPLMDWTGTHGLMGQTPLTFATKDAALEYAHDKGYHVQSVPLHEPEMHPKNYSTRFTGKQR